MPDSRFPLEGGFSRRQFFGLSAGAAVLFAGGEVMEFAREFLAQERAWRAAAADNNTFLQENARVLRNISVGASFAPEQWPDDDEGRAEAGAALRWAVEELGMVHMRLGIRWSRVDRRRNEIDLSYYAPYLDYAFSSNMVTCLNVGPIRTFRWPEAHIPRWVRNTVELPESEASINSGSHLSETAAGYLERLLERIVAIYGREQLAGVPMVQVENEPFYALGDDLWVLGEDHLMEMIRRTEPYFPQSRILLTSAGRLNFGEVRSVITGLLAEDRKYAGRMVMGFDYHYQTPLRDSVPLIRHLDPITFAKIGYQTCEENRSMAKAVGYGLEVTEGQAEPYGHLMTPGNSAHHFRFMLLRCADRVLDHNQASVIRVWGIEELAKKALAGQTNVEHRAIIQLVQRMNQGIAGGG